MSRSPASRPDGPTRLSGEAARQGRIILITPLRRRIFVGGLAAIVLLPLVVAILGWLRGP
jgi:hypothetical protein